MVEILAEPPLADRLLQVRVRRADDPGVGRLGMRAAQPTDGPLLENGQELGLQGVGKEADLVQEDRAEVRGLEEARLRPPGVRERAPLVAEQLRLDQRLGDRRAVHVDEGALGTRPVAVEEAGDEILTGSGLTLNQDRGQPAGGLVAAEEPAQRLPSGLDRGAPTEQLVAGVHGSNRLLPRPRWSSYCSASYQ